MNICVFPFAFRRRAVNIAVLVAAFGFTFALPQANATEIAANGKATLNIVTAPQAGEATRKAATRLADYLGRISGAKFEVGTGNGAAGIALGVASDFPELKIQVPWKADDVTAREDYLLRSHVKGIYLIGASELAVEHAMWDLLYRLGYRQFFPGEKWGVVPKQRELRLDVNSHEHPDYHARRIWYGYGGWDFAEVAHADWNAKNRAVSGVTLNTGHAYDGIRSRNRAQFEAHPEYIALVGGARKSSKFCISNLALRQLVIQDALKQIEKNPATDSISMDPSDGGGWCECAECAKLGSVSDQAISLANEVAAAINQDYPGKFVGSYAYNYHSPPPSIKVHPQVVVSVATAFIKGGLSLDELLSGWAKQGAKLGIREYYSVNTWDRDLPGDARGGNIAYLKRTIPHFQSKGASFMSAESSDNWGPNGLGYYLASRMMWDVDEAKRTDELTEDFLTRAFGPAKEPMREYYKQIDGSQPHLVATDQLGRMFRALDSARKLAPASDVKPRLDDLLLYARYVHLFRRYSQAKDAARQSAFEALIRHTYRMRNTMMVHSKALYRDLANRDKSVVIPAEATWNIPDNKNPWKSSEPFSEAELTRFLGEGIAENALVEMQFKPVAYSEDLVSAAPLNLPDVKPGDWGAGRGKQTFYTRVDKAPATLEFHITGGLIKHYRDRGNVRVGLFKIGGASQTGERETLVAEVRSVPPDGVEHTLALKVPEPGLYKITIEDGSDRTLVGWNSPLPFTIKSTQSEPMTGTYAEWMMYFYVPKGTKTLGLFGGEHGEVRDSAGRPLFWLNGREPNFYGVPVPDGEDGKLWHIRYGRGTIRLLTVPPYFARTAAELLLPAEVVARDAAK